MSDIDLTVGFTNFQCGSTGNYANYLMSQPIELKSNSKVALLSASIPNTFISISSALGNNTFSYSSTGPTGTFSQTVVLADGGYGITDINNFLQQSLLSNGLIASTSATMTPIQIIGQGSINRVQILITNNLPVSGQTYSITLPTAFAKLLGFNAGTYSQVVNTATNEANLNNGVLNYQIHLTCALGNYNGNQKVCDVIFSFQPNAPAGSIISLLPPVLQWSGLSQTNLKNLYVYITDQNGNNVSLNNQEWSVNLAFKR